MQIFDWATTLALASAIIWGAGDFAGALAAKRSSLYGVALLVSLIGAVLFGLAATVTQEPFTDTWPQAVAAGACGVFGLLMLYRALSQGSMGLNAPIAALVGNSIAVLVAALSVGLPGPLPLLGFVLACVSVWFIASPAGQGRILWPEALGAGLGFGLFFVLIAQTQGRFWPLCIAKIVSCIVVVAVLVVRREIPKLYAPQLPVVFASGLGDAGGNLFFFLAAQQGRLDTATVLSSLYPASTALLAWLALGERFTRTQTIGMVLGILSIPLIASGVH